MTVVESPLSTIQRFKVKKTFDEITGLSTRTNLFKRTIKAAIFTLTLFSFKKPVNKAIRYSCECNAKRAYKNLHQCNRTPL